MPFRPGEHLGDYEVIRLLGAGGMGEVYQVRNTISDRLEALKVLPAALQANKDLQERFLREIKISAALRHPHIAELRTAQRIDGLLVMVMEYVDGVTLDYLTRNGAIPLKNALHYTRQVLSALGFAHQRGVVHRDIKPQNVMVTEGDAVRLMDFGIARSLGEQGLTMTGMTLGSLFYMSPEQIRGEEVDARADLYSMGVLLYEMATGHRPFDGTSGYTVMAAHLEKVPPSPIERNPSLPTALNDLILTALQKDPAARFQSAAEFQGAIDALDREVHGRVDGLILTKAFAVKAAELPAEPLTLGVRQNSLTQTMPNTPTPGGGLTAVRGSGAVAGPSSVPDLAAAVERKTNWGPVQVVGLVFGLLITVIAMAGVFGPAIIREWRNGGDNASRRPATQPGEQQQSTSSSTATQAPSGDLVAGGPPRPEAPKPSAPATATTPVTNATSEQAMRPSPGGPPVSAPDPQGPPPPGGPGPRQMDPEVVATIQEVEAKLKEAGIDMKLYGPDAREGRRFAAIERAQQFAEVARRYAAVVQRRTALEKERQEMGRRPMPEANRRVRGRMINEMGSHWRAVSEASGAAEAAIKSQNLTLAAEKLTLAEKELDIIDGMMKAMRVRSQATSN